MLSRLREIMHLLIQCLVHRWSVMVEGWSGITPNCSWDSPYMPSIQVSLLISVVSILPFHVLSKWVVRVVSQDKPAVRERHGWDLCPVVNVGSQYFENMRVNITTHFTLHLHSQGCIVLPYVLSCRRCLWRKQTLLARERTPSMKTSWKESSRGACNFP